MAPLPLARNVCLLCRFHLSVRPSHSWLLQPWRHAATQARRRKPARMTLSKNVANPTVQYGQGRQRPPRLYNSPFGGMNQTSANLQNRRRPRSQAELRRAEFAEDKDAGEKPKRQRSQPTRKFLKMQQSLVSVSYKRRNRIKETLASITSFDQFELLPSVKQAIYTQALPNLDYVKPTPIQRLAIPAVLRGASAASSNELVLGKFDQYLLAGETGSGKTLAYLIPVIDSMKRSEDIDKEEELKSARNQQKKNEVAAHQKTKTANVFELEEPTDVEPAPAPKNIIKPKVLILVPTLELVEQIGRIVKEMAHTVKYRSALLASMFTPRKIRNTLFNPAGADILVATPHMVEAIAKSNPYILSRVTHLVVDEADSMFDKSFGPKTNFIIDRAASSLKQLILCSATITNSLDKCLRLRFPEINRLVTPGLHSIPRRVQLGVVDIDKYPFRGRRDLACASTVSSIIKGGNEPRPIIVFVNERETAEQLAVFLKSKMIDAMSLTRDTTDQRRARILADLSKTSSSKVPESHGLLKDKGLGDHTQITDSIGSSDSPMPSTKVIVVTDLASRGIDTTLIRTVILYDVPHNTIDFVHRLGRLGRMGSRGRGIVLVGKHDRKDIVREVRESMFLGQALI
ncbi:RNA helicase [Ophidiomyces ophidiicola]|nr:RNA helicase [Ophidiomyces ophidiicola]KAI1942420.1 RNA helicase [Ophidiomyces ophidiicola]KAI1964608.1 RNA helicase [Ophidiomyces ophidiicola]